MNLRFPIKDVGINISTDKRKVIQPLYSDEWNEVSQDEFSLDVEQVAWFFAKAGNYIEVMPYDGADQNSIELFLNSTVYAAILHQRKILALHGSSFLYQGKSLMLCGDSGVGKSSLTASFCLAGSEFISDDVSPVIFKDNRPFVLSLGNRLKLWNDALAQLEIPGDNLKRIQKDMEKFYLPMDTIFSENKELSQIFMLEIGPELSQVKCEKVKGAEKLKLLRTNIYRLELLQGMPENEQLLFPQLGMLSNSVKMTRIKRPANISIQSLTEALKQYLAD